MVYPCVSDSGLLALFSKRILGFTHITLQTRSMANQYINL